MLVVVAVAVTSLSSGPFASGQAEPAPYRDHAAAVDGLADAESELIAARAELAAAEQDQIEVEAAIIGLDVSAQEQALALAASEDRARSLAVEAYMTGNAASDALYLLDAPSAGDFAYRSSLLADRAATVAASGRDYVALAEEATSASREMADELGRVARRIELANDRISIAEQGIVDAEYVLFISDIHLEADQLKERNGRTEPTEAQWAELRWCESRETYDVDTGNGYWGAYQFDLSTWSDQGGDGAPSVATPAEQDARARRLFHDRGWTPLPICGRYLPQE